MRVDATENAVGSMTFFEFNKIVAGACAAFAFIVMVGFMAMHANYLSKPNEQMKYVTSGISKLFSLLVARSHPYGTKIAIPRPEASGSRWKPANLL
jgi:hypothetical protein